MSDTFVDKISYKNIVSTHAREESKQNNVCFYSSIQEACSVYLLSSVTAENTNPIPSAKRQILSELIESFGDLTNTIVDNYNFLGFANTLKLENVLDCLENCIDVEVKYDEGDEFSSEEDDFFISDKN